MVKLQTLMPLLTFLLLSSISATTAGRPPSTLGRRGLLTYCNPFFGGCNNQWPFSPVITNNHYTPNPFLRHQRPPLLYGSSPSVVVPSPPPVFTNPYFTPPSYYANPSFSPLVASPPPPGLTIPPGGGYINEAPPFLGLSYSPPAGADLPPIVGKNPPGVFMSPPLRTWPAPAGADLPPIVGEFPQQQPQEVVMPPPVGGNARTRTQLPSVVQSPPAA